MARKHVVVESYNPEWKLDFLKIKEELDIVLRNLVLSIEHVGSTSVEGLSAKPIIDIDVVIEDRSLLDEVITALNSIGYTHEGNQGIEGREAFKYQGKEHLRKHHLYVCAKDAFELKRHIGFRDYLRKNPKAVETYSEIKTEGAKRFPYDMDSYIDYKSGFIEQIYEIIGVSKK